MNEKNEMVIVFGKDVAGKIMDGIFDTRERTAGIIENSGLDPAEKIEALNRNDGLVLAKIVGSCLLLLFGISLVKNIG